MTIWDLRKWDKKNLWHEVMRTNTNTEHISPQDTEYLNTNHLNNEIFPNHGRNSHLFNYTGTSQVELFLNRRSVFKWYSQIRVEIFVINSNVEFRNRCELADYNYAHSKVRKLFSGWIWQAIFIGLDASNVYFLYFFWSVYSPNPWRSTWSKNLLRNVLDKDQFIFAESANSFLLLNGTINRQRPHHTSQNFNNTISQAIWISPKSNLHSNLAFSLSWLINSSNSIHGTCVCSINSRKEGCQF